MSEKKPEEVAPTILDATTPSPAVAPLAATDTQVPLHVEVERARAQPARVVGKFVLLEELGRGGMGVVYRAWDERLERLVALKMLAREGASDEALRRFRREAEAIARISHPNVVAIHEVGDLGERPFIAMALVRGKTLERLLRPEEGAKRIRLTKALEVLRDVARAVHHAHLHGVVHRDLKPQNIMVDEEGHPYVLDFGLAAVMGSGAGSITRTGAMLGTPAYMSPEQADGADDIDARTDVWSLGATLYHVLTGRPPYQGDNPVNVIAALLSSDPITPGSVNGRARGDLETICMKCLERPRARRYQTAQEVADDLDRYLAGDPIVAKPIGPIARAARVARRHWVLTGLGCAFALALTWFVVSIIAATAAMIFTGQEYGRRQSLAVAANDKLKEERDAARAMLFLARAEEMARAKKWREAATYAARSLLDRDSREAREVLARALDEIAPGDPRVREAVDRATLVVRVEEKTGLTIRSGSFEVAPAK